MKNNGARQTCCYTNLFDPAGLFDHTVDHVLSKPGLKTVKASITGKTGRAHRVRALAVRSRRRHQHGAPEGLTVVQ